VASALPDVRDAEAGAGLATSGMVWVRVSLDEHGLVTGARVERGATRGVWEGRLLNYVRTLAFLPALEDGVAVAGETTIPVRLGS
jgi:TonB family protein